MGLKADEHRLKTWAYNKHIWAYNMGLLHGLIT